MNVQHKTDALHLIRIQRHRPIRVTLTGAGVGAAGNTQDATGLLAGGFPLFQNAHGGAQTGDALVFAEGLGLGGDGHVRVLGLHL
ncbi:hypothetical protein D3C71_1135840 [compost metagenome]